MKTFAVVILICLGFLSLAEGAGIPLRFRKRAATPGNLHVFGRDVLWFADVKVGTPPQNLELLLDTGSGDTWVYSQFCKSEECWMNFRGKTRFRNNDSSTFSSVGDELQTVYGGGVSVAYLPSVDNLEVSGLEVTPQQLGACSNIENSPIESDGILALGPDALASEGIKPVYRNLAEQKKIPKAVFSVKLVTNKNGDGGGELIFGLPDKSQIKGDLCYVPTTTDEFWQVALENIEVGDKELNRSTDAIFDTGASVIFAPCGIVEAIYNEIPGANLSQTGNWTLPCDTPPQYEVSFKIGDKYWPVPVEDIVLSDKDPFNDKQCVGGIQQYDDDPSVILGVPFLKNYILVCDADEKQVGLGVRAD